MSHVLSAEQELALDRTRPIALAAGAGSGKTGVLIERYLRALEDVGFDVDRVLAVTFTRKATAEVIARARHAVTRRIETYPARAASWRRVRERLSGAWILTIDAFCHRLLSEAGPAAGLPADRRILTGGALGDVMAEAARQVVDRVADDPADPDHEALRLLLASTGRRGLLEELGMLVERRARSVPWAREILAGAGSDPDRIAAAVARLSGRAPARADAGLREQHARQVALARLFERFLARWRELLAAARACDFRQLLEDVAAAFRNEGLRRRFAARFRHVLVDEFQDTDPLQWEVLRKLFGTDRLERPGLFVVGDEKQAIFSFRDGDVVTFGEARQEIVKAGGAELPLADNYRSSPRLVAFFNRLSESLFPREGEEFEARHAAMASARERKPETLAGLDSRIELLLGRGENGVLARRSELRAVAARILAFAAGGTQVFDAAAKRMRPARLEDQAILLKNRIVLPELESVLTEHGVRFRVIGGVGFHDRHEVQALCNLLRFLADPQDDLALLGVLRSALFAIPDSVLLAAVRLPAAAGLRALWPKVGRLAAAVRAGEAALPTPADAPVLKDAVARLARYRSLADRIPPNELLALAVRESDLGLTLDVVDPSGRASANVDKLLDQARRCREEGIATLDELERALALTRDDTDTPEAQADPPAAGNDAVSILTVHAAKGLEWPIVFVPAIDAAAVKAGRKDLSPPARLRGDAGLAFLHEVESDDDEGKSSLHEALKALTTRERLAESKRLLYVAATRARDHLVLSGVAVERKSEARRAESWLEWVRPALDASVPVLDPAPEAPPAPKRVHPLLLEQRPPVVAAAASPEGVVQVQGLLPFEDNTPQKPPRGPAVTVPATALATLRACPRRFYLEHVLGIPGEWGGNRGDGATKRVPARIAGSIVHGALEGLALGVDPGARVAGVAARFGVVREADVAEIEAHVRRAVAKLRDWPVGKAILEAPPGAVQCEVPFELGGGATGCRLVGTIDLLHELPGGGAVIVDFKTDEVRGDPRALARRAGYVDQLEAYVAAVLASRGGFVTAWLFFTETGVAVPVVGEGEAVTAEAGARRVAGTLARLPTLASTGFPLAQSGEVCRSCPHRARSCPGVAAGEG
jgi:ATP-dependent helicase/nuclease subunit A